MKVYVVVVNYHPANAPQNYETDCQIFLDKKQAEKYGTGIKYRGCGVMACISHCH